MHDLPVHLFHHGSLQVMSPHVTHRQMAGPTSPDSGQCRQGRTLLKAATLPKAAGRDGAATPYCVSGASALFDRFGMEVHSLGDL